jgi:hypothetical protein
MVKLHTFDIEECLQCSNLIPNNRRQLLRIVPDVSSSEALNVRETWMCTDGDVVRFACFDSLVHDHGITSMPATGHISVVYERDEFIVWTSFEVAVSFAEVDINFDF